MLTEGENVSANGKPATNTQHFSPFAPWGRLPDQRKAEDAAGVNTFTRIHSSGQNAPNYEE